MRIRSARTWFLGLFTLGVMALPVRADWQRSFNTSCSCNSGAAPVPAYTASRGGNVYVAPTYPAPTYSVQAPPAPTYSVAPPMAEPLQTMPRESVSYAAPACSSCSAGTCCTPCCEEKRQGLLARIRAKREANKTTCCSSPCDACCEKSKHPILDKIRARREARKAERQCCPPPCCPAPACCNPAPSYYTPAPSCCSPY